MTEIHENNTSAKKNGTSGKKPKSRIALEYDPIGLTIVTGAQGVELHKGEQAVELADAFPDHYLAAAERASETFVRLWVESKDPFDNMGPSLARFEPVTALARLYECIGAVEDHIANPAKDAPLSQITGPAVRYFSGPKASAYWGGGDDWRAEAGLAGSGVAGWANTATNAVIAVAKADQLKDALAEAVTWLVLLHKLAINPGRQADAEAFAGYCAIRIEERSGVQR